MVLQHAEKQSSTNLRLAGSCITNDEHRMPYTQQLLELNDLQQEIVFGLQLQLKD